VVYGENGNAWMLKSEFICGYLSAVLPDLTLSLPPTVVAMSPLDRTLASLVVAGYMVTAAGRFASVVLFVIALAEVLCPKRLHFAVLPVATAVLFAAAG
jgi:hypothetical protein